MISDAAARRQTTKPRQFFTQIRQNIAQMKNGIIVAKCLGCYSTRPK